MSSARELKLEIGHRLAKAIEEGALDGKKVTGKVRDRLVECLLDGSVYGVVASLEHLQEMRETELLNQRYRRVKELENPSDQNKVMEIDRDIMNQIDEMVQDQQANLCCMGIPLFQATMDQTEIKTQMDIIKFIVSLRDLFENNS